MAIRFALIFLLVFHLDFFTAQGSKKSGIDFANSDYDYDSCGVPGMRRRVKRSDYSDDDEDDDDNEDDDEMEFQAIGGKSARKGENPWVVAILKYTDVQSFEICGGTLISRRHVVTAAHCLHNKEHFNKGEDGGSSCDKEDYYDFDEYMETTKVVVDGPCLFEKNCDKKEMKGEHLKIANMSLFSFFENQCEKGDDLIILTLEKEVKSNHACLPWLHDIIIPQSIEVESFGWGASIQTVLVRDSGMDVRKEEIGKEYENELQIVKLGKTDLNCKMKHKAYLRDKICVPELQKVSVCRGDSGAGLLTTLYRKTFVLGVLSSGTACQSLYDTTNEALFTDLRLFSATIDREIRTVGPYLG